jgi:hypothetical protein
MEENRYSRGKVYAIICRKTGRKYIGSTCEPTLARRLAKHVSDFKYWKKDKIRFVSSFDIIKDDDYYIVLLELYPCSSKDELRMCEQKHINNCECVNKVKAFRSKEELREKCKKYYEEHKEELLEKKKEHKEEAQEYNKKYKEEHKEILVEKAKEYYEVNKQKILEYKKAYLEKNKEQINNLRRERYKLKKDSNT